MDKSYFVYIILTQRGTYYCGYTDDVQKRYNKHCEGKAAKYTRANKPLKIVYVKEFLSKNEAMKEEARIKKLSRAEKNKLINSV